MNLQGLAAACIGAVNPPTLATIKAATGYTTLPGGKQVPTYSTTTGLIDVQALSGKDLQHTNELNITGVLRKVYARGAINSVIRATGAGGDILNFDGFDWKVVCVFETWPAWSAVAVAQQVPE